MLNWLAIIITLFGGLAIFLYGMNLMSEGINKSAGKEIRHLLQVFTRNRFTSLLTGTVSTALIQSSSAVSVMVISLVKAKLLRFPQTIGILLGAGIGTTITAQIIAFKIADYALVFVVIGFFVQILSNRQGIKFIGSSLLGFGFLFYGLHLMSDAMEPLRDYPPFLNVLLRLENPWTGILAGFLFTALIQSSSAFIGIVIVLASQNLINLESGIALLLGSNIGTTATAIIASFNAGYESKRVALAFFIIKLIGVLIIAWWIPQYAKLVKAVSISDFFNEWANLPRLIANAHTIFNIVVTLIIFPFTNAFAWIVLKIIPERKLTKEAPVEIKYLDKKIIASSPAIAISLAKKEVLHMGENVLTMLNDIIPSFINHDTSILKYIRENEEKVDYLRKRIAIYITNVSQESLDTELAEESFRILYINAELEEIADVISTVLVKKAEEWAEANKDFSEEGKSELMQFHLLTTEQLEKALKVIDTLDQRMASKLKKEHKKIRHLADELKHKHFERISLNVTESIKTSKLHMEITGALRIIHSHIANIMRIIIEAK